MIKEEILDKALQANQRIVSMNMNQSIIQHILDEKNERISRADNKSEVQMTFEPFTMHIKETMKKDIQSITGKIPKMCTEAFFANDTMYVYADYVGNNGDWYKKTGYLVNLSNKVDEQKQYQKEILNMLKMYLDVISFKQVDDVYIIKLNLGENQKLLNDLFKKVIENNITMVDESEEMLQDALKGLFLKGLILKVVIDTKSLIIKNNNVILNLTLDYGEEKRQVVQSMKMEYTKINDIELIKIPDNVQNNAIET